MLKLRTMKTPKHRCQFEDEECVICEELEQLSEADVNDEDLVRYKKFGVG
jgi:hypothetical protein